MEVYRRHLPHIVLRGHPLFITFCTVGRWRLPPAARTIALKHCLHEHAKTTFVHVAVIMPDHVHLVLTLEEDAPPLSLILKSIKGVSARRINQFLHSRGEVWQGESMDHVIRAEAGVHQTCAYVTQNPVRAGLVKCPEAYPWLWRAHVEGRGIERRDPLRTAWERRTDKSVCPT
ncbi:MAG TPA: transposase [Thermoanaerobaculia bacterium]|jgi:REP element-mobilizing transposase RayT